MLALRSQAAKVRRLPHLAGPAGRDGRSLPPATNDCRHAAPEPDHRASVRHDSCRTRRAADAAGAAVMSPLGPGAAHRADGPFGRCWHRRGIEKPKRRHYGTAGELAEIGGREESELAAVITEFRADGPSIVVPHSPTVRTAPGFRFFLTGAFVSAPAQLPCRAALEKRAAVQRKKKGAVEQIVRMETIAP